MSHASKIVLRQSSVNIQKPKQCPTSLFSYPNDDYKKLNSGKRALNSSHPNKDNIDEN